MLREEGRCGEIGYDNGYVERVWVEVGMEVRVYR